MKILFDHQAFSYQRYGGISRYFDELVEGLSQLPATEVELSLLFSENEYLRSRGREMRSLPGGGWLPGKGRFLAGYLVDRMNSVRRLRAGGYDLFHPTFYDDYFLQHVRTPFVVTLMDCIPERFPWLYPTKSLYGRFVTGRWIENKRRLVKSAARVIAISEATKKDACEFYGISAAKVEVIPLAGLLPTPKRPESSRCRLPERYVLYVGSRWGYKNFAAFVNAMRPLLHRDPRLAVFCAGGGKFTDRERMLIHVAGGNERYWQADVEEVDLRIAYARAVAFVFPSLWEGFGLPIVEAFDAGCACILSEAGSFWEVAGSAAEYFNPSYVESMTAAIERVVFDDVRCAELVRMGRARAARYSWWQTVQDTRSVYEKVLG